MSDREDRGIIAARGVAANDNPGSGSPGSGSPGSGSPGPGPGRAGADGGPEARIDAAVMTLARLIGRRIAREELERLDAANDNAPDTEAHEG